MSRTIKLLALTFLASAGSSYADFNGFIAQVKSGNLNKDQVLDSFKALPSLAQGEYCKFIMDPEFVANSGLSVFQRRALIGYCEKFKLPEKPKEVGTLNIPDAFRFKAGDSQETRLKKTKQILDLVILTPDTPQGKLIKELRDHYEKAQEQFSNMEAIMSVIREDIKEQGPTIFKTFKPLDHESHSHEAYLNAVLQDTGNLARDSVSQLQAAQKMLQDAKSELDKAEQSINALQGGVLK